MREREEFLDKVHRMVVTVRSPDRTVTLTGTYQGDLRVELADGCLSRHTEQSLARQVAIAARVGLAAMQRGYDQITAEFFGSDPDHGSES